MDPMDEQEAPEASDGTYTIEIECHPDGTYTVSKESGAQEASESEGSESGEAAGQEFSNPKEAITAVLELMKGGQMANKADESSQMAAGFRGPEFGMGQASPRAWRGK